MSGNLLQMDLVNLIDTVVALAYLGLTIYTANVRQATGRHAGLLRVLQYGIVVIMVIGALLILLSSLLSQFIDEELIDPSLPVFDITASLLNFVVAIALAVVSVMTIHSERVRGIIQTLSGRTSGFNPESHVHITAVILCLAVLSSTIGQLVISGGVSGLAETYETTGISLGDVLFNQAIWVVVSLLGVGLFIRRALPSAMTRLGFRFPTLADIGYGVIGGFGGYLIIIVFGLLTSQVFSAEQIAEQNAAAEQIAQAFNTIPLALIMSAMVSVGEEIFFRGALQPIFGIGLSSVFFVVLHTQYAFAPATIALLFVTILFGVLRQRLSTTAAVIAHFTYNFIQLAVLILAASITI